LEGPSITFGGGVLLGKPIASILFLLQKGLLNMLGIHCGNLDLISRRCQISEMKKMIDWNRGLTKG
jgi:hypothetical protein